MQRGSLIVALLAAAGCTTVPARERDAALARDASADAAPAAPPPGPDPFTLPITFDDAAALAIDPALLPSAASPCRQPMSVRVISVADGDTLTAERLDLSASERVRLIGVDTPEIAHSPAEVDQCYGPQARQFTEQLIGHVAWLSFDATCLDPYGRTLAYVSLSAEPAGSWNRQLLRRGLGSLLVIGANRGLESVLASDQSIAQSSGAGLWSSCF